MKDEASPFNGHTALLLRAAAVLVPLSLLVAAGAAVGALVASQQVRDENRARLEAQCESADETRVLLRALSKDSALEVGEALIDVVPDADPETVAAFRGAMNRRLTAIVNQLPGREWDEQSQQCVDVPIE